MSSSFDPLLGLSFRTAGHALCGAVDGLNSERQYGQQSVSLGHTQKPQTGQYTPISASKSGNGQYRCGGG